MYWYLIHAKPRQETLALENLERQGYECYLPLLKREKLVRRKRMLVEEALFPGYLFIHLDTSSSGQNWGPIRSTVGVRTLVRFGDQPAKVDARLIDALRAHEQAQNEEPRPLFSKGERVVVTDGPFAGIEAIYQMEDAESRSLILLEILSKPVQMRIEAAALRKAE